ncbi:MAG: GAF domain-containing protein [Pseudomonadota bacterium]
MHKLTNFEKTLDDLKRAVEASKSHASRSTRTESGPPVVTASGHLDTTAIAFGVFTQLLATDGIRAALYAVLRQSNYRFISIFRFQDGQATSVVHVDREQLAVTQVDEVPENTTYCFFVSDDKQAFVTADATTDERTQDHVARDTVQSYCGIPILEPEGGLIGVLCHHDVVPRDPEQLNLELLVQVSSALGQSGLVPDYPDLRELVTSQTKNPPMVDA